LECPINDRKKGETGPEDLHFIPAKSRGGKKEGSPSSFTGYPYP
jgi:hypothetical protein